MRILFSICLLISLSSCIATAQTDDNSIYKLPDTVYDKDSSSSNFMLAGSEKGLYKINANRTAIPLWQGGKVSKIIRTEERTDSVIQTRWYFLTNQGIVSSTDLSNFEFRNEGLPFLTIKQYDGTNTSFLKQCAQLKDLSIHPTNSSILVTATKDAVFITYNGGISWKSLGSSASTAGIKAVAVCDMNRTGTEKTGTDLVVFMSHPIYGFSYYMPLAKKPAWKDCNGGFDNMKSISYPDEISDILPVVFSDENGSPVTEVFVSQSYLPRIYRFDWVKDRGELLYSGSEPVETIDSLFWNGSSLLYTKNGEVAAYNPATKAAGSLPNEYLKWQGCFSLLARDDTLYSVWLPSESEKGNGISLNELWLLYPDDVNNKYASKALDRKAIYVSPHKLITKAGVEKYKKTILDNKLNAIVIDMKDDFGALHYEPTDPLVKQKGYISRYKIDLDTFVPAMKENGIYLVARIVTFKDESLAKYGNSKYAVWDRTLNKAWKGIQGYEKVKDENGNETGAVKTNYYDEVWVDPYCPEVWEYAVHIAQDLISQGFDEIQFDYIRFPTDGKNMSNAQFRWRSEGMDRESALVSFLRYARANIDAPIGIDIYGANGWYRSGARTGQDVELLAEYVDVVCPMFYPSHFENSFLNYAPVTERPYRVYYYGTYRNTVIGRNKLIIRPWVQAFYLNVPYDRVYYNENYVRQQIYGVRDSVNRGYMYWNQSGRYDDISPDVGDKKYPGPSYEADSKYRKPALSGGSRTVNTPMNDEQNRSSSGDTTAWDTIREQENRDKDKSGFPKLSDISKLWQAYSES
ncbi:putative glycoside hydrolase [Treponema sp.]|uniref:putative glycoside hydrolase n=1 Tax=Treponema sp. TaxID=166 RepID=UPI00388E8933